MKLFLTFFFLNVIYHYAVFFVVSVIDRVLISNAVECVFDLR